MTHRHTTRFTLIELMIASMVLAIIVATLAPLAISIYKNYMAAQVLSKFESEVLTSQEWLKIDLACSSRSEFVLYPQNQKNNLIGVSFPVLRRGAGASGMPMDADGNIEWTETVVYHLFTQNGETELRRTVFKPRITLTQEQRQTQLQRVCTYGDASFAHNSSNANTMTLLTNIGSHNISAGEGEIDTYASSRDRQVYSCGTWIIEPGYHTYKFTIKEKNDSSSGYGIGIDQIMVSATGEPIEAEAMMPVYADQGANARAQDMSFYGVWSNHSQLEFPASASDQYMTLEIYNDCWVESTFADDMASAENSEVGFDFDLNEVVCRLSGNTETWEAVVQSEDVDPINPERSYLNTDVRVIVSGADLALGENILHAGERSAVMFQGSPSTSYCNISEAYIMERTSGYNGDSSTLQQLTFGAASGMPGTIVHNSNKSLFLYPSYSGISDWVDLPIDPTKDYIVSFHIGYRNDYYYHPAVWVDPAGDTHSYIMHTGTTAASQASLADWSGFDPTLITGLDRIVAVESVWVSYPATGTYTSEIMDTRLDNPQYAGINWRDATDSNTDITLKVRAGDQPDLSDASAWSSASSFTSSNGVNSLSGLDGRYVQWQAVLESNDPFTTTPKLRDVYVRWQGERRGVEVTVIMEEASNRGKFELTVDDTNPQPAQLRMEFTLNQPVDDVEYTKRFAVEVTPKN